MWATMFCGTCWMCYQLHLNTRVSMVLLRSFLLSFGSIYGQENHHNKYFMYNGYLCIEPCLSTNGCIRWVYPLVVLIVICKWKLWNIVNGAALSLNWYGNATLEYLLSTFPYQYSHEAWWFGFRLSTLFSIMMSNLWTMVFTLSMEVFVYFH